MSNIATLMQRVHKAGGELIPLADERIRMRAPAPLPADLVDELRAHKTELLEALQGRLPGTLRERIQQARDWRDLEDVLADAQQAFVQGSMSGPSVEDLAECCVRRSKEIPEHAGD